MGVRVRVRGRGWKVRLKLGLGPGDGYRLKGYLSSVTRLPADTKEADRQHVA